MRDPRRAWIGLWSAGLLLVGLSACTGPQSSLAPAGQSAERIADLFWWMTGGALLVWAIVVWLTISAVRGRVARHSEQQARFYVIGGGVIFPTVVLAALLIYGLGMMSPLLEPAPPGSLRIAVTGEQWWWRVRYHPADGSTPIDLANEIRLPVGEPVEFTLESPDVIHSFWIPALGGKMDMIPGRQTRLRLDPTRAGSFRGQCAEYCGTSHALMAFPVIVMEPAEFASWLEHQREAAAEPVASRSVQGREHFFLNGCAACHTIRGTEARGLIGPDLTHVGSRLSLGAALLPNNHESLVRWLGQTDQVKPGVQMPHYGMLPREELAALADYLMSLQ